MSKPKTLITLHIFYTSQQAFSMIAVICTKLPTLNPDIKHLEPLLHLSASCWKRNSFLKKDDYSNWIAIIR